MSPSAPFSDRTMRVARVRCRGAAPDRARIVGALDRWDGDSGLPASAILVIRRLQGTIAGSPANVQGVDLPRVAREAHRAWVGTPPPHCGAVVFGTEADLLSCLARDVHAGRPLGWWWSLLLYGDADRAAPRPSEAVGVAFTRLLHALPAAAAHAPRAVTAAAATLDRPRLLELLGAVAAAHAAPALARVARGSAAPTSIHEHRSPASPRIGGDVDDRHDVHERRNLDDVDDHDAPAAGTSPNGGPMAESRGSQATDAVAAAASLEALVTEVWHRLHAEPTVARGGVYAQTVRTALTSLTDSRSQVATRPAVPASASQQVRPPPLEPMGRPRPDVEPRPTPLSAADGGDHGPAIQDVAAAPVRTDLAGAVYLLPLLDRLDLPASANGPGEPGEALTRGHVLSMVLACWHSGQDPLVDLVAELGGATAEVPTIDGRWAFRIPPAALELLPPPESAEWLAWKDRLRITDGASGVVLADVPLPEPGRPDVVARCLEHECGVVTARTGRVAAARGVSDGSDEADKANRAAGNADQWAACVAGLLEHLLGAMGLARTIVEVPGTVELDEVTLRVTIPIESIDIAVRRSGLDATPGWVPALGRSVEVVFT